MPSQLNRRAVFAALSAFVLALAVAYALSSTGEASEVTGPPGAPAQPLDVASGIAGQTTLGDAEALPALVRKPKPKKHKSSGDAVNTSTPSTSTPSTSTSTSTSTTSSTPTFTPPPASSTPTQSQTHSNPPPPVQFEDSG
jgi:hypothetical protein